MNRPPGYEWAPLQCDGDPVPGDVEAITQERAHLQAMAETIRQQIVVNLVNIASGDVEVGQHADVIRAAAANVARRLNPVADRYEAVAQLLGPWSEALARAQELSVLALVSATEPYETLVRAGAGFLDGYLIIPESIADEPAVRQAKAEWETAARLLRRTLAERDGAAHACATAINAALDDALKDSYLQRVEYDVKDSPYVAIDWTGEHSVLLTSVAGFLEDRSLEIAIVNLFAGFDPELRVYLTALDVGLTAVAFEIRFWLALTGNGPWSAVGWDALALLADLAGSVSPAMAARIVSETGKAAGVLPRVGRILRLLAQDAGIPEETSIFGKLAREIEELPDTAENIAKVAERLRPILGKTVSTVEKTDPLLADAGKVAEQMRELAKEFPESTEIAKAAKRVARLLALGKAGDIVGDLSDLHSLYQLFPAKIPVYDRKFAKTGWQLHPVDPQFWQQVKDEAIVPAAVTYDQASQVFKKVKSLL